MLCLTSFFYKISYIAFDKINLNRARLDFGSDSILRIRFIAGSDFLNMPINASKKFWDDSSSKDV